MTAAATPPAAPQPEPAAEPTSPAAHFPLRGVRVLEWGDLAAVPYAARLLADAGAEVVRVESSSEPGGPPQAGCAGSVSDDRLDPARRALDAYLNRGKHSVALDLASAGDRATLRRLAEAADVFLHDRPALAESPLGVDAGALRVANPRLIVTSVTPFGERGPRSRWRADDLIVVSASDLAYSGPGLPDHVEDPEAEPPLHPNAHLGELIGGLIGAIGALFALLNRDRTGRGDAVEVSKQEALACLLSWDLMYTSYGGFVLGRHPARINLAPNHYLPIADGWAAIVAFMDNHWSALVDLMGNPDWAADPRFATGAARGEHWEELEPLLLAWLLEQPGQRFLADVQSRGIPCAPALSLAEAIDNEQMAARRFLVPAGLPGDSPEANGRLPGDVYVIDGRRRPTTDRGPWTVDRGPRTMDQGPSMMCHESETLDPVPRTVVADGSSSSMVHRPSSDSGLGTRDSRLPLAGIRVIDFGQMVAMPMTCQWLAFLGAEVIYVESRVRPGARLFAPFAGEPSLDTAGIFNHINRNKRGCTINLSTPTGVDLVKRLIAMADVVAENFSPGTMEKLGLGYETLRQLKPDLIMMSLSACGSTGPWRNFSALHSGVICLSGLAAVTGYEGGHPRIVGAILPDPVAATYCALGILQALYHRNRTGRGQHIEVAMTETLQSLIPEAILEYTRLGREPARIGNRHPWKAPHGIYRARGDDRWLAISVETDAEWRALGKVLGRPGLADDPRFADPPARRSHVAALDAIISDWSRAQVAEDAAERLQQAGVPATLVYNSRDVLTDAHLIERGFIVEDDHPRAGRRPMPGAPWSFHEMPPVTYRHAPLVGQDNAYVFGEILELDAEQMRRLEAAQVIY